jgi:hypothetical protein
MGFRRLRLKMEQEKKRFILIKNRIQYVFHQASHPTMDLIRNS